MTDFIIFDTPLGLMALEAEGNFLTHLRLPGTPIPRMMPHETPVLAKGRDQLLEYLAGQRQTFDLPLAPEGTPFQQRVWAALREIPYGQTRSYKDIARAIDCGSAQAVGQANKANPLPIFTPCHRVIAADGSLGGYAFGLELKRTLLTIENIL